MKIGDAVWRIAEWPIEEIEEIEELEYFATKEEFKGWFSFNKSRESAIIRCDYDGGLEVLTEHLFPNKKEAQKSAAPKILKALKRIRTRLEKEQKQLDKHYQRWLILVNQ